jgi:hypothetical protein
MENVCVCVCVCVCVPILAGLRGTILQCEYCAVLCRLCGHGQKTEVVQGWGVLPSEMELLQGCAGQLVHGLVEIVNVC